MENNDLPEEEAPATEDDSSAMLTPIEARVLGTLMEKQLTTPDAYPLTLNSLVTACNQKTNREPVMNLQPGGVQHCLNELESRSLVELEYGSRATRFKERLTRVLHQEKPEHSIFSVMMLRGPQTLGELLTRTQRLYEWENQNELEELLDKLLNRLKPIVQKMPRHAGMREERYMHLLCGEPDPMEFQAAKPATGSKDELEARVAALEEQVALLMKASGLEQDDIVEREND